MPPCTGCEIITRPWAPSREHCGPADDWWPNSAARATASVLAALRATLGETCDRRNPWNYPSDAEFNLLLERHGFEVLQSNLFDRPTPLEGENGMEDWLQMFCGSFLDDLSTDIRREKISELVARLGPTQYQAGVWTLDYRRLRVLAAKAR